jgi:hypothetical protein
VFLVSLALTFATGGDGFEKSVLPFVTEHCVRCHGGAHPQGDLVLEAFRTEAMARADPATWLAVRAKLAAGEMPPEERPRPPRAELDLVLAWIDDTFGRLAAAPKGGRVGLRRLTRTEYENSIRDLFGIEYRATEEFPADDVGRGFDRIADVLSTSDIGIEKYLRAAERIAAQAVVIEDPAHPPRRHTDAPALVGVTNGHLREGGLLLYSNGDADAVVSLPRDGEYVVRANAWGEPAGPDPPRMALRVDRREVARFEVRVLADAPKVYEKRTRIAAGEHRVAASFLNDYYKADDPDPANRDRNLGVVWIEVVGPVDDPTLSRFQAQELDAAARHPAREIVERLAARAWRRPADAQDVDRLLALSAPGASAAERVRAAIAGILISPRFLYLLETDPAHPGPDERHIDDWALAARLAAFLWSSVPDERLAGLAAQGKLHDRAALAAETQRMLDDGRATAFAWDFAAQWLQLPRLDHAAPDPAHFPAFDEPLRAAMRAETELCFESVLRENRPALELLASDTTFVNERLARLYGIPGVRGDTMRRVHVEPGVRGGVLGQASILTLTSNPTRTSPAKRGKWILENLLADPPPPPPPGVGVLDDSREAVAAASLRDRLARHRTDPACATCHARIDPLGLALENLDAVGSWRTEDSGFTIDASGSLPDGRSFRGLVELRDVLAKDPRPFLRCLGEKLATYALSRELSDADRKELEGLFAAYGARAPTLRELVVAIATTDAFRRRAGGGA